MALREVRINGDPILNTPCKEVTEMSERLQELVDDMIETMHEADGVGIAAPQVGVLRRICIIDVGEECGTPEPLVLVNPVITESEGEHTGAEGCLSLPGYVGDVTRPLFVTVKAKNRNMEDIEVSGEGLLARAMCHEIDHLNGHMYTEFVEGSLREVSSDDDDEEE